MLFDLAAWALIILVAYAVGSGVLAVLGADQLRLGDRFILATWTGIVFIALALLGVSLLGPLSPIVTLTVGGALAASGTLLARRFGVSEGRRHAAPDAHVPVGVVAV